MENNLGFWDLVLKGVVLSSIVFGVILVGGWLGCDNSMEYYCGLHHLCSPGLLMIFIHNLECIFWRIVLWT